MTGAEPVDRGTVQATGPFVVPEFELQAFSCPHCGAYAAQQWGSCIGAQDDRPTLKRAICSHCDDYSVWRGKTCLYPTTGGAPVPNPDLPDDVRDDFEEARLVASLSPRGAAALLRLAIQKLCIFLGEPGNNLNDDIGRLVGKGLRPEIQQALDAVRVIGNNSVHPGQMDMKDDKATAEKLFVLVNVIAEAMVTIPNQVSELYDTLPDGAKQQISERDA